MTMNRLGTPVLDALAANRDRSGWAFLRPVTARHRALLSSHLLHLWRLPVGHGALITSPTLNTIRVCTEDH